MQQKPQALFPVLCTYTGGPRIQVGGAMEVC